jgi:hypothetical protein
VGLTTHAWTASMVRASAAVDVFAISAITVRMFVLVVFVCSVIFAMFRLHVVIVIIIVVPTINFQNSQPVP